MRLYILLWLCALPVLLIRLFVRRIHDVAAPLDLAGRFGLGAQGPGGALWVHAVSAGEIHASVPLVHRLRGLAPRRPVLVTCTTAAGRARAQAEYGDMVHLTWLPFDLPWCVDAFLDRQRPALLLLVETELWPLLISRCAQRGIPVILVNARLSARSAHAYGRVAPAVRPMFAGLTRLLCQDEMTATRFARLGARPSALAVTGSLKFEPRVPEAFAERVLILRRRLAGGPAFVIVAGSTHEGEERALLAALAARLTQDKRWRLVLVPRHPRRFEAVARLCTQAGWPPARASAGYQAGDAQLVLWDCMGDLFALYGAADAAFVGGSLAPCGGHNPLEAAWHGTPVLVGPSAWNFEGINACLAVEGGLVMAESAQEVATCLAAWADDEAERARRGAAARAAVVANSGALAATETAIAEVLQSEPSGPGCSPPTDGGAGASE